MNELWLPLNSVGFWSGKNPVFQDEFSLMWAVTLFCPSGFTVEVSEVVNWRETIARTFHGLTEA